MIYVRFTTSLFYDLSEVYDQLVLWFIWGYHEKIQPSHVLFYAENN